MDNAIKCLIKYVIMSKLSQTGKIVNANDPSALDKLYYDASR